MGGLKDVIQRRVRTHNPADVSRAMELAYDVEEELGIQTTGVFGGRQVGNVSFSGHRFSSSRDLSGGPQLTHLPDPVIGNLGPNPFQDQSKIHAPPTHLGTLHALWEKFLKRSRQDSNHRTDPRRHSRGPEERKIIRTKNF
ncbi:hypothetical protein L484_022112 [Morus notabilis]|uniref:Uncharacterized protein n=1 Tax=Morus notabilis TaxID=981085 RepID=W9QDM6_9ROSA|nr:hypothetical protein L484_022112 [Morus notabilis]